MDIDKFGGILSYVYLRSTLGITCGRGSFAVHFGDHLRSRDHLGLGIICGTVQTSIIYFILINRKNQFDKLRRLTLFNYFSIKLYFETV